MTELISHPGPPRARFAARNTVLLKVVLLLVLLYFFILSIILLGASFKLFGREFAETIFRATSSPIVGLVIGILTTAVIQSSSTTTSLIVGLVASGVLTLENAIPMVMGANIGTTVTATIVSLGHLSHRSEFVRAFAASTVHDFFNLCSVLVLLPLQIEFNLIGHTAQVVEGLFESFGGLQFSSPLGAITKPVAHEILALTGNNAWIGAGLSFIMLVVALRYIVKLLRSLVLARVERFFQRYIFRNAALGFILGIMVTALVQSSSITTSIVIPLVGAGVITLAQIYPYLLGANVGTTITAFLASFAIGSPEAVMVAFAHLTFNVFGIVIFWPLRKIPIFLAVSLSKATQKSKLVPIVFIAVVFFIIPGIVIYLMG
jgi:sodium-dependent phosphate cotransporter